MKLSQNHTHAHGTGSVQKLYGEKRRFGLLDAARLRGEGRYKKGGRSEEG